jgi:hypothetical protein
MHRDKLNTLLESGAYEILSSDPTAKREERYKHSCLSIYQLFLQIKKKADSISQLSTAFIRVTKNSQIWDTIETNSESNWLTMLRNTGFIQTVLKPLAEISEASVRNSDNSIQLLKPIELQDKGILVIFDVVSLFTNVPIENHCRL